MLREKYARKIAELTRDKVDKKAKNTQNKLMIKRTTNEIMNNYEEKI
jgi:hypothetical protein